MKTTKPAGSYRPFENLDDLIRSKSIELTQDKATQSGRPDKGAGRRRRSAHGKTRSSDAGPEDDTNLFLDAMSDVKPIPGQTRKIRRKGGATGTIDAGKDQHQGDTAESTIVTKLNRLVRQGEGFVVENTPEYKEWTGFNVNPWITQRLHRGEFSIQEYIDLHGLSVREARVALEAFLRHALSTRKHAVLIVHGRGLSSRTEPILKTRVYEWLTSGTWKKWVIAFTSARLCDGGAGATYVLLRQNPLPKRLRKKRTR